MESCAVSNDPWLVSGRSIYESNWIDSGSPRTQLGDLYNASDKIEVRRTVRWTRIDGIHLTYPSTLIIEPRS